MNYQNASFEFAAGRPDQLPASTSPEIVFSGKSNVGKSTLINKLLNRKALARVSSTPGKTGTINAGWLICPVTVMRRYPGKKSSAGRSWWKGTFLPAAGLPACFSFSICAMLPHRMICT